MHVYKVLTPPGKAAKIFTAISHSRFAQIPWDFLTMKTETPFQTWGRIVANHF
jgi:hypothetical protein